jgi:hypothetical protein
MSRLPKPASLVQSNHAALFAHARCDAHNRPTNEGYDQRQNEHGDNVGYRRQGSGSGDEQKLLPVRHQEALTAFLRFIGRMLVPKQKIKTAKMPDETPSIAIRKAIPAIGYLPGAYGASCAPRYLAQIMTKNAARQWIVREPNSSSRDQLAEGQRRSDRCTMPLFLYRCPNTGQSAQAWRLMTPK